MLTQSEIKARPRRLFCWSGGGFPGLDIHAGMWRALSEHGIVADANAGTSAGAIVAALNSSGVQAYGFENLLRSLTDRDMRVERFAWKLCMPWIDSFLDPLPIRSLLHGLLPETFEALSKPLWVHVTDERGWLPRVVSSGDLRHAVLASMSIMGVFPRVMLRCPPEVAPRPCSDGGTSENLPLPPGWQDFEEVWLLIARRPVRYTKRENMLTRLMRNIDALVECQVMETVSRAMRNSDLGSRKGPKVYVLQPDVHPARGALHFDHDLIVPACVWAGKEIAEWTSRSGAMSPTGPRQEGMSGS